ncbi:MAG: cytochrome b [Rhodospirillaceae bacterium]|jgi:ubiquinol-cytochrome c reductase cytochrome b/c1 subunit|nr:cytochrome b [Rhodospirillaceae bacterium]MBT7957493.1 cytochrome b [Rhodospirillaceae bacterium]
MSTPTWKNPIVQWVDHRLPIVTFLDHAIVKYPTPRNLNYWWNFGSLAGVILVVMIGTGIMLAMNYVPHTSMAFDSVERIMRDINYGWLIRYLHVNGGSMFFICVYIHIFRGMYYGSYKEPRELLWIIGIFIFLAMMATAFLGYVLPWGQMSFWGATVITNLFSVVPFFGEAIVQWLWGGFSVDNPTLNKFFSFHYLLPFIIFALVFIHLWALHTHKSSNPLGIEVQGDEDEIPFHPYYTAKDAYGFGVFLIVFLGFTFFAPNFFGEPDNYIEANPLVTPTHIVPEWYFLPFYAILRAVPDNFVDIWGILPVIIPAKTAGVIAMFASILVLLVLPWLDTSKVRSAKFRPTYFWLFWLFFIDTIILGYIGAKPAEGTFLLIGRLATAYYFLHLVIFMPLVGKYEKTKPLPDSISAAVTAGGSDAKEGS